MLSSVATESPFHALQGGENGTVQVSAAKGSVGLLVERAGEERGLLLTSAQASSLGRYLMTASSACASHQAGEEQLQP